MDKIKEFISLIVESEQIVIVSHINPDGDAIGSVTGFKKFLQANGNSANVVVPNRYPEFLEFLDPGQSIIAFKESQDKATSIVESADLIICMDFNSLKRIEGLGEVISVSKAKRVLIDHHLQPEPLFDIIFSDPQASSTCEVAYYLIKEMAAADPSIKSIDIDSGLSFYTGLMTDTNNFANSVRPQTFKMAGELLELGIDKEDVQFKVYSGFREQRMRMMGYMLNDNMKVFPEHKAGFMLITKELKERFDFKDGDSDGFVNLPLNIKGVEVSGLFTEADGFVKVSLRSKGDFSVNALSRAYFNGGGHQRAAGGKIYIPV
ncbi:MAG: bifunctional oligoribonuclease/PAP phosphatase NrnA, partial [Bacteroidales bacterium]|nr:bifunctional oligoribonuclease/PAP phosphatase NrnA [Bacteroidales bacterium]